MSQRVDIAIKHWLLSAPGQFRSDVSRDELFRKAWAASGIECSVADFESALKRAGYNPEPRGTSKHPCWFLTVADGVSESTAAKKAVAKKPAAKRTPFVPAWRSGEGRA